MQELVPDATVVVCPRADAGAQSWSRSCWILSNGDIDVLVSTTIIETGLDIPNANTMIIHDADTHGTCPSCISCGAVWAVPAVPGVCVSDV